MPASPRTRSSLRTCAAQLLHRSPARSAGCRRAISASAHAVCRRSALIAGAALLHSPPPHPNRAPSNERGTAQGHRAPRGVDALVLGAGEPLRCGSISLALSLPLCGGLAVLPRVHQSSRASQRRMSDLRAVAPRANRPASAVAAVVPAGAAAARRRCWPARDVTAPAHCPDALPRSRSLQRSCRSLSAQPALRSSRANACAARAAHRSCAAQLAFWGRRHAAAGFGR